MQSWICPECGRECANSEQECSACGPDPAQASGVMNGLHALWAQVYASSTRLLTAPAMAHRPLLLLAAPAHGAVELAPAALAKALRSPGRLPFQTSRPTARRSAALHIEPGFITLPGLPPEVRDLWTPPSASVMEAAPALQARKAVMPAWLVTLLTALTLSGGMALLIQRFSSVSEAKPAVA